MTTRYRFWLLPILILWLAFALRLYRLDYQSIWWDEGHSIFVARQPVSSIPALPDMDVHPPAYFVLLHGWMTLTGNSEFGLRFLSVLFGMLLLALLWPFAATIATVLKTTPYSAAGLTALFSAVSPLYVAYSQEVRSYTLILLLATASTFALWHIIFLSWSPSTGVPAPTFARGSPLRWLVIYVFFTAACLYTHYFALFLLVFQNLVWFVWLFLARYRQFVWRLSLWLLSQLAVLILLAPQLYLAYSQITAYINPNLNPPGLGYFIERSWQAYVVGLTIAPAPARWGMLAIAAILIGSWLFILVRALFPNHATPATKYSLVAILLFLVSWFLVPLLLYFLVLQRQPSFEPRYLILATPPIFLLLALGLVQLPAPHSLSALQPAIYATPPLLIFLFSLQSYFTNPTYFKDDAAAVASWLAAETTPRDAVYVDVPHPFHYYVERQAIPAPPQYFFVDVHTAAARLNREASGKERLFWITWWGSDTDPRGVMPFLVQKVGKPAGRRDFKGYHVQWFTLPPAVAFSLPAELTPLSANFGDVLRLDGAAFGLNPATDLVWITSHFSLLRDTNVNYKVSLRLRNEAGDIVAQQDKDLLNDRHFRTAAWPVEDAALNQALNVFSLMSPAAGTYQLEVVVYNAEPPYPAEGVSGHDSADGSAAILGRVTVRP